MFNLGKRKKKIGINSIPFCETCCPLLVPRLHQGQTVQQAWDEIQWLIDHDDVRAIFEKGLAKDFSPSFLEEVEKTYLDHYTGHLLPMLYLFSEIGSEHGKAIADALTVLQVKGKLRPTSYAVRRSGLELLFYFKEKVQKRN